MTFELHMSLPSVANLREHWSAKAKRVRAQRSAVMLAVPARKLATARNWLSLNGRVVVTLTRISPRELDGDNLQSAFKACRDSVAAQLGIDDRDSRVAWVYKQAKGPQAVRIEVQCVDARQVAEVAI